MVNKPITEPGILDIPIEEYHQDPALSSSGAKVIMNDCPALYRYGMDNPQEPNRAFDIGHVAHKLILGEGSEIVRVDAADWRKKEPKAERDEAYEAGKVPVLEKEYQACEDMAAAVLNHPFAKDLFRQGKPEQSIFWRDEESGAMCRARPDWLPEKGAQIFPDYKTTVSANPVAIARAMDNYAYFQQAAWYRDGIISTGHHQDPIPVFVFQEKKPPYLVTVAQLDRIAIEWGDVLNAKARALYAECMKNDAWPGYAEDVVMIELPRYAEMRMQQKHEAGDYQTAYEMQEPLEEME